MRWRRSRARLVIILLLVSWLAWPSRAGEAALSVVDVGAIAQLLNTVSALARLVGLQTKDLAALANIGPILEMMRELQLIVADLEAISDQLQGRSQGWVQLSHPSMIPCTAAAQRDWLWQATEWGRQASHETSQAYGLILRTGRLMQSLLRLVNLAQVLFGTTSGLQSVAALTSVSIAEMQKLQTVMISAKQAMVGRDLTEQMIVLSSTCMQQRLFEGFGTYTPPW